MEEPVRPQLVIFDCDGVLVDSEPTSSRVLAASITNAGLAISGRPICVASQARRRRLADGISGHDW